MNIPSELIGNVEKIEVWIENTGEASSLVISVTGMAASSGWKEPLLKYVDNVGQPPQNIHPFDVYDFQFWVKPPQVGDAYAMALTPVTAQFKWAGYSKNMKVIRVHSKAGFHEKWVELGGAGTPLEPVSEGASDIIV